MDKLFPAAIRIATIIIFSSLTIQILHAQEAGFFLDDWQEKTAVIPSSEERTKPSGDATVLVNIDMAQIINKVPQYIYGNNAVTWNNGLSSNTTALTDLKNLSPNVLRWPGGNLSNNYFWNLAPGQRPEDIPDDISPWYGMNTQSWQMSVDEYYSLLQNSNSTGLICVNYSYARYGTSDNPVAKAAHMAAEWVRYDNGRTKFWEIGNENFGSWQSGYEINTALNKDGQPQYISGALYGEHCKIFIDSMRAAAAEIGVEIMIAPNVFDAETSYDPINTDWNEGLMPEIGHMVDFLAVHSYFTPYAEDSPVSTILNSHTVPEEIHNALAADMIEAGQAMLPVAMTEWNIFAEGSMQQVSYINGMLAAITLGEYVNSGYGMANRWDLVNGWSDGNDHGMFSTGGEPGVDAYNPRAVFFYMYYHQKFFGDRMVQTSLSGSSSVVAHASSFSSGEAGLVLVNKGNATETVEINFSNYAPGEKYYTMTLTGGTDNGDFSRKVLLNGIETDEEGGGPDNYESIKAYSFSRSGGMTVELPPLSVVYVMTDKGIELSYLHSSIGPVPDVIKMELSEGVKEPVDATGFSITVNGSVSHSITNITRDTENPEILLIELDKPVMSDDVVSISYSSGNIFSLNDVPLSDFTSMTVENLVPAGPFDVRIIVRNSGSEALIESCRVYLDNETLLTNADGEAIFSVIEGNYSLAANKLHLDSLYITDLSIRKDTTINVYLDSTTYTFVVHVVNAATGQPVREVKISKGSDTWLTDNNGNASLYLIAGSYTLDFSNPDYYDLSENITVDSNSSTTVELIRSVANVKFKIYSGSTPVNGSLVILNNDTLVSNALGMCTFTSKELTYYDYSVISERYYPLTDTFTLHMDTTINLQVVSSVANVEFHVSSLAGDMGTSYVVLGQDTLDLNDEGKAKFYGVGIETTYDYKVVSEIFFPITGNFYLERDTVITAVFTGIEGSLKPASLKIFPNPARDRIQIESDLKGPSVVKIYDLSGKLQLLKNVELLQHTEIYFTLPEGIYFLKIESGEGEYTQKLVIN